MLLTSVNNFKTYSNRSNPTVSEESQISNLISSFSKKIGHYCNRNFKLMSYEETFPLAYGQQVIRPKSYPVLSIASIYFDATGLFNGSETIVSTADYYIFPDSRQIILACQASSGYVRITFNGGLADHAVNEDITVSGATGTIVPGATAIGTNGGRGLVKSYTSATHNVVIENLFGQFEPGDTLSFSVSSTGSAVLVSKNNTILANDYQDLVFATNLQCHFWMKNVYSFEAANIQRDGSSSRFSPAQLKDRYDLLPEVKDLLERFRNKTPDNEFYV